MELISRFIFFVGFIFLANWVVLRNLLTGYVVKKSVNVSTDKKVLGYIEKHTGVTLSHFNLQESDKAFGYCGGMPGKPLLVLSTTAYKKFSGDMLHWLLLHEMGHYVLSHTFWHIGIDIAFLLLGEAMIWAMPSSVTVLLFSILLIVLLASLSIQLKKLCDLFANRYALDRLEKPTGQIEAMRFFIKQAAESGIFADSLIMRLFYPWNLSMYDQCIHQAQTYTKGNS